jgi:hypothetical protein
MSEVVSFCYTNFNILENKGRNKELGILVEEVD